MSKYHKLLLLTVVLMVGAAAVVWNIPMRRGLDLAGGIRVVLQAEAPKKDLTTEKMGAVLRTIQNRVKGMAGVAEPIVQTQGRDRIIVELPGLKNKEQARYSKQIASAFGEIIKLMDPHL